MAWKPVSKAKYWEMLEVLPPAAMSGDGFLVGEPVDHNKDGEARYEAFFEKNGRHFVATEPMTVSAFREGARGKVWVAE